MTPEGRIKEQVKKLLKEFVDFVAVFILGFAVSALLLVSFELWIDR